MYVQQTCELNTHGLVVLSMTVLTQFNFKWSLAMFAKSFAFQFLFNNLISLTNIFSEGGANLNSWIRFNRFWNNWAQMT